MFFPPFVPDRRGKGVLVSTEKILETFRELLKDRTELEIVPTDNCSPLSRCFELRFTPRNRGNAGLLGIVTLSEGGICGYEISCDPTLRDWLRPKIDGILDRAGLPLL